MKKALSLGLCVVLLIGLTSCKPSDVGELSYEMGKEAIEAVDDYLDYKIKASAAYDRVKEAEEKEDIISYDYNSPTYTKDMGIRIKLTGVSIALTNVQYSNTDENRQAVLEVRNELAELLGMSARSK